MKISKKCLIDLIKESIDYAQIKTVAPGDYEPQAAWDDGSDSAPRDTESYKKKDRVGSFFMIKLGSQPKGYNRLRKNRYFYMTLPDGEAIKIGSIVDITDAKGRIYLEMLDANVTPLAISDIYNMSKQDKINWKLMQDSVLSVQDSYATIRDT